MNDIVTTNYSKVKPYLLYLPISVIVTVILFLYLNGGLSVDNYIGIQKDTFFLINAKLSQLPVLQNNITELGNILISFSILSILIFYIPKIWEVLFSASLVSLVFSRSLKELIDVPRPATIFNHSDFTIIGEPAVGFSSCPSGHSISIFTTLVVIMLAIIPIYKSQISKILIQLFFITIGLFLAFSRVAVGAHHPLDVILGCSIGYISAVLGVFINEKYPIWRWISNPRFYPILALLLTTCFILIIIKITEQHLFIYFFASICLIISLYLIIRTYYAKNLKN